MRLEELRQRLQQLHDQGYITSKRSGSTGVGYTLEKVLGVSENNLPIPDIGGRVELKATRSTSNALITLFTFNRGVWKIKPKDAIEKFGYTDTQQRQALKCAVSAIEENPQGLILILDETQHTVSILHKKSNTILAQWSLYHLVGKFVSKFERMIFVKADARKSQHKSEEFHYIQAELLQEPNINTFLHAMRSGTVLIDIRMHIQENGGVRNRGTAIRVRETQLPQLFAKRTALI